MKRMTWIVTFLLMLVVSTGPTAESVKEALTEGEVSGNVRYRLEWVDQELPEDAEAHTVRLRLGYKTASFYGFKAFAEFEGIRALGGASFNSTANGKTEFPVVPDPEDEEVNQLYLDYDGVENLKVRLGRQRIIFDNARFIGNVGFRQNEQTYDAAMVQYTFNNKIEAQVYQINNVNRIFGEHHPVPARADLDLDAQLLRGQVQTELGTIVVYLHLLEFINTPDASHQNLGFRFDGKKQITEKWNVLYAGEFAIQEDHADGLATVDSEYLHAGAGFKYKKVVARLGLEILGGDGVYAFQTPLATLHKFNGWTDQFLAATPVEGLKDVYLVVSTTLKGTQIMLVYHDFSSDTGSLDYGHEWGAKVQRVFKERYKLELKYGNYSADGFSVDTEKLWFEASVKF